MATTVKRFPAVNEAEVKRGNHPTAPFYPGLRLEVVRRGRHVITVEYFDGREMRTADLEVCTYQEKQSE